MTGRLSEADQTASFEYGAAEGRRVVGLIGELCATAAAGCGAGRDRVPFADVRFGLTEGQRRQF